jgi:hypothetical protein
MGQISQLFQVSIAKLSLNHEELQYFGCFKTTNNFKNHKTSDQIFLFVLGIHYAANAITRTVGT